MDVKEVMKRFLSIVEEALIYTALMVTILVYILVIHFDRHEVTLFIIWNLISYAIAKAETEVYEKFFSNVFNRVEYLIISSVVAFIISVIICDRILNVKNIFVPGFFVIPFMLTVIINVQN